MSDAGATGLVAWANEQLRKKNAEIDELRKFNEEYRREAQLWEARYYEIKAEVDELRPKTRVTSLAIARDMMRPRPTSPENAA